MATKQELELFKKVEKLEERILEIESDISLILERIKNESPKKSKDKNKKDDKPESKSS